MNNGGTVTWYFNADTGEFEKATTKVRDKAKQTGKEVDDEIRRIINECYERARKILIENRNKLEAVTQTLLEKETIMGDEFEAIMNDEFI